jgi:hypothetical protein
MSHTSILVAEASRARCLAADRQGRPQETRVLSGRLCAGNLASDGIGRANGRNGSSSGFDDANVARKKTAKLPERFLARHPELL